MADIALAITDASAFDVDLDGYDLLRDDGLETAVFLSLFTDRRASADIVPAEFSKDDLRGYWGDTYADVDGDQHGSLLWTLEREKQTGATLARAQQYVIEALDWMKTDFVSDRIEVATSYSSRGIMSIQIDIYRPGKKEPVKYQYDYEWATQVAKTV